MINIVNFSGEYYLVLPIFDINFWKVRMGQKLVGSNLREENKYMEMSGKVKIGCQCQIRPRGINLGWVAQFSFIL
jgi:hypothetical protein